MRVLLDTDVVLDLMLDRQPFAQAAFELWTVCEQGRVDGYVSVITPVNVFYFARKQKGIEAARQIIAEVLSVMRVCAANYNVLQAAHGLPFTDFEDAVQHTSATASQLDAIITRNTGDYANATLPVFTPADFLTHLAQHTNDDHDAAN